MPSYLNSYFDFFTRTTNYFSDYFSTLLRFYKILVYFNVSDVSRKILVKSCCRTCSHVHTYSILHQRRSTFKGNGILTTRAAVIYRAGVCQSTSKRLLSKPDSIGRIHCETISIAKDINCLYLLPNILLYAWSSVKMSISVCPLRCYPAVRHIHQRYDT